MDPTANSPPPRWEALCFWVALAFEVASLASGAQHKNASFAQNEQ